MGEKKTSDAQIRANIKWQAKATKRVPFSVRKEYYADILKPAADAAGLPVNTFIRTAIDFYIAHGRDFEKAEPMKRYYVEFSAGPSREEIRDAKIQSVNYMVCHIGKDEELYAEVVIDDMILDGEDYERDMDAVDERSVKILSEEIRRQAKELGIDPASLDFSGFA